MGWPIEIQGVNNLQISEYLTLFDFLTWFIPFTYFFKHFVHFRKKANVHRVCNIRKGLKNIIANKLLKLNY